MAEVTPAQHGLQAPGTSDVNVTWPGFLPRAASLPGGGEAGPSKEVATWQGPISE